MNAIEEYEQEKREREEREKNRWEFEKLIHRALYTNSREDFDQFFESLVVLKMKISKNFNRQETILKVHDQIALLAAEEKVDFNANFATRYLGLKTA